MVLVLAIGIGTQAQTRNVEKQEAVSKSEDIYLNFKFADEIKVEQWDKNEIAIAVSVYLDNGEGNEAFNLKTERTSGQVKIYSDFGNYFEERQKRWKDRKGSYNSNTEIDYVVKVPKGANLKVKSISGSMEVPSYVGNLKTDLISGDVTLKKYNGELRLKTVSGDLDVTMNKARIDAKTVTGTIYSDLDIQKDGGRNSGQNRIKGTVNNGNEPVVLTTVSGNIYMRKG